MDAIDRSLLNSAGNAAVVALEELLASDSEATMGGKRQCS